MLRSYSLTTVVSNRRTGNQYFTFDRACADERDFGRARIHQTWYAVDHTAGMGIVFLRGSTGTGMNLCVRAAL